MTWKAFVDGVVLNPEDEIKVVYRDEEHADSLHLRLTPEGVAVSRVRGGLVVTEEWATYQDMMEMIE